MAQGITIKGKTSSGQNVEVRVSPEGIVQVSGSLKPGVDYDYLSITNSNTDEDTLVYKLGGSGGTVIQTLVIAYASGAEKLSDSFSNLTWS